MAERATPTRRAGRTAAPGLRRRVLGFAALALLTACSTAPLGVVNDSQLSYDRTFNTALAAVAEQKMIVEVQDRRFGQIVGTLNGDKVTVAMSPQLDGAIQVRFAQQGSSDPELLKRVIASYNARMSNASLLGGFRDAGDQTGPVPCPSGPAFCK